MLEKLKNFDPRGGFQLEDAIVLAASARQIAAEFDLQKVEKPGWLDDKIAELSRFIGETQRDARKKKLAELRARHDSLKTPTERKAEIERQIADLEVLAAQ